MKQNPVKITKETRIGQAIKIHPKAIEVLQKYLSPHCVVCPGSHMETIEQGALMHGHAPETIDKLIKELNELISN